MRVRAEGPIDSFNSDKFQPIATMLRSELREDFRFSGVIDAGPRRSETVDSIVEKHDSISEDGQTTRMLSEYIMVLPRGIIARNNITKIFDMMLKAKDMPFQPNIPARKMIKNPFKSSKVKRGVDLGSKNTSW